MELQTLTQMVANALNALDEGSWEYEHPKDATDKWATEAWGHVKGVDGMRICLHYDSHKKRLSISGDYPREGGNMYPYSGRAESISVSAEREPAAIARDIIRRYLPTYKESYAVGKAQWDRQRAFEAGTNALIERMCAYVNKEVWKREHERTFHKHYYIDRLNATSVGFSVEGPNSIKLEFSCTEEFARKVLDFLGTPKPVEEQSDVLGFNEKGEPI